jgi:hypothetical protein
MCKPFAIYLRGRFRPADENIFGSNKTIVRCRKACINGHLHQDLGDFLLRQAYVKAASMCTFS